MKRLFLVILSAALLAGCASMQPKIDKVFHRHHRISVKKSAAAAPPIVPSPVIVTSAPTPEKPTSFFQRHHLKWTH